MLFVNLYIIFCTAGTLSATHDVMINKAYFKKCQEKKHFMTFTILVILNAVSDKYDNKFDIENYIILKNRTVSIHKKYVRIFKHINT